jgi:hypothetical protein
MKLLLNRPESAGAEQIFPVPEHPIGRVERREPIAGRAE